MNHVVSSLSNPIVKEIKKLYKRKYRWQKKLFIVEGIKIIEECIKEKWNIKYIIIKEDFPLKFEISRLIDCIDGNNIIIVSEKVFNEITDMENPQGILGVIEFNLSDMEFLFKVKDKFFIIIDELQDPGNMGTIIRAGDAFGVNGIIITQGCVDIYSPKVVRSTMGSIFHVPIVFADDKLKLIKDLKEKKVAVYATSLRGNIHINRVNFRRDFALIIGNESNGVTEDFLRTADSLIKIPMKGKAESLNAAIASSIIMYEVLRQRG